jgi:hypothetical protein
MLEREKQNRERFVSLWLFFTPLCCFAGIEMKKEEKQVEEKVPRGADLPHTVMCTATFPKRKVYFFIFVFGLCVL